MWRRNDDLGLAVRHRILRKAVAEIGHRVFEPLGQRRGAGQRVGAIREELRHRLGRLQVPLGIAREPPAGGIERRVWCDARQHVEERTVGRLGEPDAVGGDRPARETPCASASSADVVGFLVAQQVALQLDVHVARGRRGRRADRAGRRRRIAARRAAGGRQARRGRWCSRRAPRAQRPLSPFARRDRASSCASRGGRDCGSPPGDVDEDGQATTWHWRLGTWDWALGFRIRRAWEFVSGTLRISSIVSSAPMIGAQPGLLRGLVEARRAVDAVGVEQRERRIAERRRPLDERFGQRGALKKAERRRAVELDVHGDQQCPTAAPGRS